MVKVVRVIIVLAKDLHKVACAKLSETVYKKGEDWVVVEDVSDAEQLIVRGEPQLLIVNGKLKATVFVMKLGRDNPALKAGCLSTGKGRNPEQYQYRIQQRDRADFDGLIKAVTHYLKLTLPTDKKA